MELKLTQERGPETYRYTDARVHRRGTEEQGGQDGTHTRLVKKGSIRLGTETHSCRKHPHG